MPSPLQVLLALAADAPTGPPEPLRAIMILVLGAAFLLGRDEIAQMLTARRNRGPRARRVAAVEAAVIGLITIAYGAVDLVEWIV